MTDGLARQLGDTLRRNGFTVDGVRAALGPGASAALDRDEPAAVRFALGARGDVLAALVRLFLLGDRLETLPDGGPWPALRELGLLRRGAAGFAAAYDLRPYDDGSYVVSDLADGPLEGDHVLGVGGASLTLATLTPRARVTRALDVGTGSGVQALHLAAHADHVTATDVSSRALRLAALTAGLSGVSVDLREGSLLDPVAGEAYDLVVSNPPFVVSPTARYTYRDAGLPADSLGATLLAGLPGALAPGGTAVVLANWLHVEGEDWRDRVASWIPPGTDAWVAQREVLDPVAYVGTWLRDAGPLEPTVEEARHREWHEGLLAMGAQAVGFGWIALTRDPGGPAPRLEDVSSAVRLPRGDEVAALLAARADPVLLDARALLASRPVAAPGLRVTTSETWAEGVWGRAPSLLDLATGWRAPVAVDDVTAALVRRLDGAATLAETADAIAPDHGLDADDLRAGILPVVRELAETGHLRV